MTPNEWIERAMGLLCAAGDCVPTHTEYGERLRERIRVHVSAPIVERQESTGTERGDN